MSTDRLRTSPLDTEHLDEDRLLPERVVELEAAGHPVDVVDRHLVVNDKPDDDSSGYLVAEIETTPVPREDAKPITLFVCHCAHAHYRVFDWSNVGGPDGADPGEDKHVQRVLRSEKRAREVDDDQITLADGGRSKCVECGAWLPDEIEPDTGVYCPRCGHGQHIADGGQVLETEPEAEPRDESAETTAAETDEPVHLSIEANRIASEAVANANGRLPDFEVYCATVECTQDTLIRVVGR